MGSKPLNVHGNCLVKLQRLYVVPSVRDRRRGFLIAGFAVFPCALGRSGILVRKREGDGGTPRARLPLRRVFVRPDKGPAPSTLLPRRHIGPADAWCDDRTDRRYNRLIKRPPARRRSGSGARTTSMT